MGTLINTVLTDRVGNVGTRVCGLQPQKSVCVAVAWKSLRTYVSELTLSTLHSIDNLYLCFNFLVLLVLSIAVELL